MQSETPEAVPVSQRSPTPPPRSPTPPPRSPTPPPRSPTPPLTVLLDLDTQQQFTPNQVTHIQIIPIQSEYQPNSMPQTLQTWTPPAAMYPMQATNEWKPQRSCNWISAQSNNWTPPHFTPTHQTQHGSNHEEKENCLECTMVRAELERALKEMKLQHQLKSTNGQASYTDGRPRAGLLAPDVANSHH
ncbi:DNA-directed RNA polymerase II subunit RPB1-like, partial [Argopecten irradians]|uniref:DNA-directed RNA polymerase II subunit RPB1-like n=1 Tax=Argopecten irradians TaxID=31199 RepID=UPI003721CC8B